MIATQLHQDNWLKIMSTWKSDTYSPNQKHSWENLIGQYSKQRLQNNNAPPPAPSTKEDKRRKYDQSTEARKENDWVRSSEMPCVEMLQEKEVVSLCQAPVEDTLKNSMQMYGG